MSLSILKGKQVDVHLWTRLDQVESGALDQLRNIAALPWAFHHVAVMPDVHYGKGATVGSVVAMKDAIAPAAVGVDIGCGMAAVRTNLDADKVTRKLSRLRGDIEATIPVGFATHDAAAWSGCSEALRRQAKSHMDQFSELSEKVRNLDTRAS